MKFFFPKSINPKQILRIKSSKSKPKSISAPSSFNSTITTTTTTTTATTTSSGSSHGGSLLKPPISGDWSDADTPGTPPFDYIQAFKMIDLDGDGKITRLELESLLRRLGGKSPPPTEEEIEGMIKEIDIDGDGCISLDELRTVGYLFESKPKGDELREVFDFFDKDNDGRISAEELQAVFGALGDERCTLEDCRRMIEGVDDNGDGFVCFQEFSRMMELQQ